MYKGVRFFYLEKVHLMTGTTICMRAKNGVFYLNLVTRTKVDIHGVTTDIYLFNAPNHRVNSNLFVVNLEIVHDCERTYYMMSLLRRKEGS